MKKLTICPRVLEAARRAGVSDGAETYRATFRLTERAPIDDCPCEVCTALRAAKPARGRAHAREGSPTPTGAASLRSALEKARAETTIEDMFDHGLEAVRTSNEAVRHFAEFWGLKLPRALTLFGERVPVGPEALTEATWKTFRDREPLRCIEVAGLPAEERRSRMDEHLARTEESRLFWCGGRDRPDGPRRPGLYEVGDPFAYMGTSLRRAVKRIVTLFGGPTTGGAMDRSELEVDHDAAAHQRKGVPWRRLERRGLDSLGEGEAQASSRPRPTSPAPVDAVLHRQPQPQGHGPSRRRPRAERFHDPGGVEAAVGAAILLDRALAEARDDRERALLHHLLDGLGETDAAKAAGVTRDQAHATLQRIRRALQRS